MRYKGRQYKRNLFIAAVLIFVIIFSASCNKSDGGDSKDTAEQSEKRESKKKNKKDKKSKKEKKDADDDKKTSISANPHIVFDKIYESKSDSEAGRYLYTISVNHLSLKEEGKEFEPLRKAFDEYNKSVDERFEEVKADFEDYSIQENGEYPEEVRTAENETYVIRADKNVVSILNYEIMENVSRTSMGERTSYNFDTSTGKELKFTDVVKDTDAFCELLDEAMEEDFGELELSKASEYLKGLNNGDFTGFAWTLNAEGLTVYFDTYELGDYDAGSQIVTVYFDEGEDIFESKYVKAEKDYVFPLFYDNMTLRLDVDDDGERDMVYINNNYQVYDVEGGEYAQAAGAVVISGMNRLEFEGFDSEAYIIKKEDKYYMYLIMAEVDDMNLLYVIDLNTMEQNEEDYIVAELSTRYSNWVEDDNGERNTAQEETFTDPDSFVMSKRFDMLSTITGEREYEVGNDGYPVSKSERYKMTSDIILHTKGDVPCSLVDGDGNVKNSDTIPADSYILFIYSAEDSFVDVRVIDKEYVEEKRWEWSEESYYYLKDGSLLDYDGDCYRITIQRDEENGGTTIDGLNIGDLLEGDRYAG